jgi:hypothetical protein
MPSGSGSPEVTPRLNTPSGNVVPAARAVLGSHSWAEAAAPITAAPAVRKRRRSGDVAPVISELPCLTGLLDIGKLTPMDGPPAEP